VEVLSVKRNGFIISGNNETVHYAMKLHGLARFDMINWEKDLLRLVIVYPIHLPRDPENFLVVNVRRIITMEYM